VNAGVDVAAGVGDGADVEAARLRRLEVRDFRNLEHVTLTPPGEGLAVIGENGQGKTNLLESIYYLQILRSARGARDQDLVRFGQPAFHIAAVVEPSSPAPGSFSAPRTTRAHEIGVGFERAGKRKRVRIDGEIPTRLSDALGALPSVLFSPSDVELVAGSPNMRRRYLDIMLALTTRGYLAALQQYRAALLRRNAALRAAQRSPRDQASHMASIAAWEPALAQHGATIWSARAQWTESIARSFEVLCAEIGESSQVRMRYASSPALAADPAGVLAASLEEKRALDVKRGLTHVGPHRDDLTLTIDGRELRGFGSAGQQRSAAIAMRMLEVMTFKQRTGRTPLFLLDDPFAELDARRSSRILDLLTSGEQLGARQIILAVPRADDIPRALTSLERLSIADGQITPFGAV
jgi:DNA replication and repair protein RecF